MILSRNNKLELKGTFERDRETDVGDGLISQSLYFEGFCSIDEASSFDKLDFKTAYSENSQSIIVNGNVLRFSDMTPRQQESIKKICSEIFNEHLRGYFLKDARLGY